MVAIAGGLCSYLCLDLSNNLCSSALQQLEPVAVTLIHSKGKCITVVITFHPTLYPLVMHCFDLQIQQLNNFILG